MNRAEKVNFILQTLENFYPTPEIPLAHSNNFTFLTAVILSAHTTDAIVNKVTPKLFSIADNPYKMSVLDVKEIAEIIMPCGCFNKKAKAISEMSKMLVEKFKGLVPATFDELESLPGVGHKTASVVMAQVFGHPAFAVDTHIARLAGRWKISRSHDVKKIEADLKNFFPQNAWNKLHLQMIYYGRKFCPARNHYIEKCPICKKLATEE